MMPAFRRLGLRRRNAWVGILAVQFGSDFGNAAAFEDYTPEAFDRVMAINARTPFFLTQALLPLLKIAGWTPPPSM